MSRSIIQKDFILSKHVCLHQSWFVLNGVIVCFVIPEVLCLPLWSPAHGLVGSIGR